MYFESKILCHRKCRIPTESIYKSSSYYDHVCSSTDLHTDYQYDNCIYYAFFQYVSVFYYSSVIVRTYQLSRKGKRRSLAQNLQGQKIMALEVMMILQPMIRRKRKILSKQESMMTKTKPPPRNVVDGTIPKPDYPSDCPSGSRYEVFPPLGEKNVFHVFLTLIHIQNVVDPPALEQLNNRKIKQDSRNSRSITQVLRLVIPYPTQGDFPMERIVYNTSRGPENK